MSANKSEVRMVQIATATDADGNGTLYGVDANGVVYQYLWGRQPLPRTPGDNTEQRTEFGPTHYWWSPLRMRTNKGPEPEVQP